MRIMKTEALRCVRQKKKAVRAKEIALANPTLIARKRFEPQERDERTQNGHGLARRVTDCEILCCGAN
jgi:hypothetical protein